MVKRSAAMLCQTVDADHKPVKLASGIMMIRRFLTLSILLPALLAGCRAPSKVLQPLPPPYVPKVSTSPKPPSTIVRPPRTTGRSIRGVVVVVDPGHGGRDSGAFKRTKSSLPEKTIVLDIANKLGRLLADRGARVSYTRTADVFISLEGRARFAERSRADLFVSIHANAASRTSASGVDVFIYDKASLESQRAAHSLVAAFRRAGIECRGMYRENFHVLREHSRPAVLIEAGFLTNTADARKLNSASYRSTLASTIADGIANYFSR
ncbi:MAG: N-acetylmuramoyl-L-alanine amidase family protein [Planctomycetota bacterium]|jgi:N-acetylmuramoyl-L-alanine amidase